jgi:hypothetical protein
MTSPQEESTAEKQSRRKKLGRAALYIGFSIIIGNFISSLSLPIAYFYLGAYTPESSYLNYSLLTTIIGIALILVGLIAILHPKATSKDGVWIMMLSPYVGPC